MEHCLHLYVEYKRPDKDEYWGMGGLFMPGIPALMSKLGLNHRDNFPSIMDDFRGLPDDLSGDVFDEYTLMIYDPFPHGDRVCSSKEAEGWIAAGNSIRMKEHWISQPDFYWESWVSGQEFLDITSDIDNYFKTKGDEWDQYEIKSIAAMIRTLFDLECQVRVVYWFGGMSMKGE